MEWVYFSFFLPLIFFFLYSCVFGICEHRKKKTRNGMRLHIYKGSDIPSYSPTIVYKKHPYTTPVKKKKRVYNMKWTNKKVVVGGACFSIVVIWSVYTLSECPAPRIKPKKGWVLAYHSYHSKFEQPTLWKPLYFVYCFEFLSSIFVLVCVLGCFTILTNKGRFQDSIYIIPSFLISPKPPIFTPIHWETFLADRPLLIPQPSLKLYTRSF